MGELGQMQLANRESPITKSRIATRDSMLHARSKPKMKIFVREFGPMPLPFRTLPSFMNFGPMQL
jgi:hypothetical protein